MSGYESISDYAFENFPIEESDNFQDWIEKVEKRFLEDGRAPLNKIFDASDYNRIEIEWEKRKGIEDKEEKEQEALDKFVLLQEQWEKDVKEIVKDLPKDSTKKVLKEFGKSIFNSLKKIRGFFSR